MQQPVCLTAEEVKDFCLEMKGCKDAIINLTEGIKRIEGALKEQKNEFDRFKSYSRDEATRLNAQWGERFDKQNETNETRFSDIENTIVAYRSGWSSSAKTISVIWGVINSAIIVGGLTYFWNLQNNITQDVINGLETKYNIMYETNTQTVSEK